MSRKKKPKNSQSQSPRPIVTNALNRHRTLSRLALTVLVPVILVVSAEGLLRLFSFGYPTDFFLEVENSNTLGTNRQFGWRFFPKEISRTPLPQSFRKEKPQNTVRIFTLGASAAMGVPNAAFSFSRSLEVMLRSRYPDVRFEFVNTAMVAINSHVVRPIADECARYDPDILLVYLGNNEVIGPYSIGASSDGISGNLQAIKAGIALRSTRLGQVGQLLAEKLRGATFETENWRGMQSYAKHLVESDAPGLASVHADFRSNLEDICSAATTRGAKVVLSTVAVNLRNSAPFASVIDSTLSPAALSEHHSLINAAIGFLAQDNHAMAKVNLEAALAIDPGYADTYFLLGQIDISQGNNSSAYLNFSQALEYDALRFRADRRINQIIRNTATEFQDEAVLLADTEQSLRSIEPSGTGVIGKELFYEHVHLTFLGNYLVARSLLPTIEQALPDWARAKANHQRLIPTLEDCGRNLMFTEADAYSCLSQMLVLCKPYPFTAQLGHEEFMQALTAEMEALRARAPSPELLQAILDAYKKAHQRRPNDFLLALNYARLLRQTGNNPAANSIFQKVLSGQPAAGDLSSEELETITGGKPR